MDNLLDIFPNLDFDHSKMVGPPSIRRRHKNPREQRGDWEERVSFRDDELKYNPNNLGAINIIRMAFSKYIKNTPIESNTLGIQIHYLETQGSSPKTMFITKRMYTKRYGWVMDKPEIKLTEKQANNGYFNKNDFQTGGVFSNDQLNGLLDKIQGFYKVLQVMLCEVYNDDPIARHYYEPWAIPIKLLYRDVPDTLLNQFTAKYEAGDVCGICQDFLKNGEEHENNVCISLNCQHGYHCGCIQAWFDNRHGIYDFSDKCPQCKRRWVNRTLTPEQIAALPDREEEAPDAFGSSFGKRKMGGLLRKVNADIMYLKSKC